MYACLYVCVCVCVVRREEGSMHEPYETMALMRGKNSEEERDRAKDGGIYGGKDELKDGGKDGD